MPDVRVLNELQIKKDGVVATYRLGTVNGYYNSTDGKFYEDSSHTIEIEGAPNLVYADIDKNGLYIWKQATASFVKVSGIEGSGTLVYGYLNSLDGKFYEEDTYTTEIPGDEEKLFITLDDDKIYRYDASNVSFVVIGNNLILGETSSTAYRGDRGKIAYDHATDANKISAATTSGFYKVGATAEGHVSSLTAVAKADITALGIPDADDLGTAAAKDSTSTITSGSTDLIEVGAVYTALQGKANSADLGTAAAKNYTTSVTSGSADVVTSGGVYTYVDTVITQALTGSY